MKNKCSIIIIVFLLNLCLVSSIVYAQEGYSEITEIFCRSLKEGNYSILYPYLSDDLRQAFNEEKFRIFRSQVFSSYGYLKGYTFIREEKINNFTRAYYVFVFEHANVTFMLVFEKSIDKETGYKYVLSGIWIKKVQAKSTNQGLLILPMIGGIIPIIICFFIIRKIEYKELLLGFALVLLILFVQSPIQQAPFIVLKIFSKKEILSRGYIFITFSSLWLGTIAGIFQETLKYFFSRNKPLKNAMFLGLGFGLGEAIIIPITTLISYIVGQSSLVLSLETSILSFLERFLVSFFHGGTTTYLAYGSKNNYGSRALLIVIVIHSVIDTLTAFYQFIHLPIIILILYLILASLDILFIRKSLKWMNE